MAQTQNPLIGRMKKSIGNLTSLTLKGKNIIKSKPLEVKQPGTTAQTNWTNYFNSVVWFVKHSKSLIDIGFNSGPNNMPPFAKAMQYNLSLPPAMINFLPYLDFNLAQISRGSLPGIVNFLSWVNDGNYLCFSFDDNSSQPPALPTDKLYFFVVNSDRTKTMSFPDISSRISLGGEDIWLSEFYNEIVYVFFFFYQPETCLVSDTFCSGPIELADS